MNIEAATVTLTSALPKCEFFVLDAGHLQWCRRKEKPCTFPVNCPNLHGFTSNEVLKKLVEKWMKILWPNPSQASAARNCADELKAAMKGGK